MIKPKLKIFVYSFFEKILGENLTRNIYKKKCVERYLKSNCVFIHIPKCGGTSITHQVFGQRVGHFTASEIKNKMQNKFNEYYSFSVTRHPLDRLYSAYTFVKNDGGQHGAVKNIEDFQAKEFRSFDSFVQEWLVFNTNKNILFKPQYLYLCNSNHEILVNQYFKIENKKEIENVLRNKLNKNIVIKHLNKTLPKKSYSISASTIQLVEEIYKLDYELFSY